MEEFKDNLRSGVDQVRDVVEQVTEADLNIDQRILKSIYDINEKSFLAKLMELADLCYYPLIFGVTAIGMFSVFVDPSSLKDSRLLLISYVVTFIIERILKKVVNRERPYQQMVGISKKDSSNLGKHNQVTSGFPSGHASTMFSICTGLSILLWNNYESKKGRPNEPSKVITILSIILCMSVAILITVNRSRIGMHYPSDIVTGSVIGTVISLIIFKTNIVSKAKVAFINHFLNSSINASN